MTDTTLCPASGSNAASNTASAMPASLVTALLSPVKGVAGMNPCTSQASPDLEDQVAQAFQNIKSVIEQTLRQAHHPAYRVGMSGWEYVVKLRACFVGLSAVRDEARAIMARHIKKSCRNHQPLFTMTGIESLPFEECRVELQVDVWLP